MKKWILVGLLVPPAAWLAALPARSDEAKAKVVRVQAGGGGYLGAAVEDVSGSDVARLKLGEARGVQVRRVTSDSPAARAGLRSGDVILRFGDEAVRSAVQFSRLVRETPPGRRVELELSRAGSVQKLTCELGRRGGAWASEGDRSVVEFGLPEPGELPDLEDLPESGDLPRFSWRDLGRGLRGLEPPGPGGRPRLGVSYQPIGGQLARYFKLEADSGVLVTEVAPGGAADQAGLRAGDVILSFDGQAVSGERDLRKAVQAAEAGRALSLEVWREGRKLELKATLSPSDSGGRRGRPL